MGTTICGIDCSECPSYGTCKGCVETDGQPFGGECIVAAYCQKGASALCEFKKSLIAAFNALNIEDMEEVTDLNALVGQYVNLEYPLPSGQKVKFWDDRRIYLGNQLCKKNSDRCYGLVADEKYLLVCEYGEGGSDPEIVTYKRWN